MAEKIITAIVHPVPIGDIQIEGLLLNTGDYAISAVQINELISFSTSNNTISRDLKRLLGENFSPSKVKLTGLKQLINCILLIDFEKVLLELTISGNKKAANLSRNLIGLSLRQLFADAFCEKFDKEDRQNWLKARVEGKEVRRTLTDAIRDWYQRNPGKTTRPIHAMYAVTTNAIYQKLWNVEAKTLEQILGCSRNESRDFLDSNSLRILERAEARVSEFIDDDNIKPIDAVEVANIKKAKTQPGLKNNG